MAMMRDPTEIYFQILITIKGSLLASKETGHNNEREQKSRKFTTSNYIEKIQN